MTSKINLLGLLICFFYISCTSSEKNQSGSDVILINNPEYGELQHLEHPPFQFNLIDSLNIEIPDDYLISGFSSLLTDSDGNMYFMDRQQSKLISVSGKGEFRWMTGQEGKGPGDFENAYSMITDGKQLLIGNLQGSRLDKFDFNGNFISSQTFGKEITSSQLTGIANEGHLVLSTPLWGGFGKNIFVVDFNSDSTKILSEFEMDQSNGLELADGISSSASTSLYNDKLISGSITDYSINTYNLQGIHEKTIRRDFAKIMRPGFFSNGSSRSIRIFGGVKSPYILPTGYFLVSASWPINVSDPDKFVKDSRNGTAPEVKMRNSLDLFNPDGKLLFSQESEGYDPTLGSINHIDENGIIYITKTEPYPVILKYSVSTPEI